MQLVEEELFRDLLTTGVIVLVNNLINILYHTTLFFFLPYLQNKRNYRQFCIIHIALTKQENFSSRSCMSAIEFNCQARRKFDILMSSSYSSPQDIRFRRFTFSTQK